MSTTALTDEDVAHAETIARAYEAGLLAQKCGTAATNPYYADTQQWIAFNHGAEDQAAWTLKRGGAP